MFLNPHLTQTILIALVVGACSGAVGAFIVLRRMALVGDALSHVALPGIALALAYGIDPFFGVIGFLTVAAVIVWLLEERTNLPSEAIVGLLFTASLAVGILTIPSIDILESLFGEFPQFNPLALTLVLSAGAILTIATFFLARRFLFAIVSSDLARTEGLGRGNDLVLLLIFAFAVSLGIKLVGTLLMGALTIIPAAIAKNISGSMKGYMIASTVLGALLAVSGVIIADSLHSIGSITLLPGPTIILLGAGVFLVSLSMPFGGEFFRIKK